MNGRLPKSAGVSGVRELDMRWFTHQVKANTLVDHKSESTRGKSRIWRAVRECQTSSVAEHRPKVSYRLPLDQETIAMGPVEVQTCCAITLGVRGPTSK